MHGDIQMPLTICMLICVVKVHMQIHLLSNTLAETHTHACMQRTEEFVSPQSLGRQLCSDVLIIFVSSLLINDPSVPSH